MDPRVVTVVSIIARQPQTRLPILAASVNLSLARLRRLFKAETSCTLCKYVKQRRLARGQELLQTTDLSVKQVSAAVGFTDADYFAREFRRTFSIRPTVYRESGVEKSG